MHTGSNTNKRSMILIEQTKKATQDIPSEKDLSKDFQNFEYETLYITSDCPTYWLQAR